MAKVTIWITIRDEADPHTRHDIRKLGISSRLVLEGVLCHTIVVPISYKILDSIVFVSTNSAHLTLTVQIVGIRLFSLQNAVNHAWYSMMIGAHRAMYQYILDLKHL